MDVLEAFDMREIIVCNSETILVHPRQKVPRYAVNKTWPIRNKEAERFLSQFPTRGRLLRSMGNSDRSAIQFYKQNL